MQESLATAIEPLAGIISGSVSFILRTYPIRREYQEPIVTARFTAFDFGFRCAALRKRWWVGFPELRVACREVGAWTPVF